MQLLAIIIYLTFPLVVALAQWQEHGIQLAVQQGVPIMMR